MNVEEFSKNELDKATDPERLCPDEKCLHHDVSQFIEGFGKDDIKKHYTEVGQLLAETGVRMRIQSNVFEVFMLLVKQGLIDPQAVAPYLELYWTKPGDPQ